MQDPRSDAPDAAIPLVETDFRIDRPALWHFEELSRLAAHSDVARSNQCGGFWMLQRYEHVREALQNPALFTNDTISPFHREQQLRLVPQILNPPVHRAYRQLLNPWFSPASVARVVPEARARAAQLVAELAPRGACDFVADFALRYPTELFLHTLGLPVSDGEVFLPWVETIFAGFFGGDADAAGRAIGHVYRYFDAVTAERETRPRDPATDFISYLLTSTVDGEALPRPEVLTICLTLTLAGLDTTRSQLGYIFHHLAGHRSDRERLVADSSLVPIAVEEFLRLYTLVMTAGRRVATDVDFHGCPMKAGDVVWLGLLSANRDPDRFPEPDRFDLQRQPNPHLAFAGGIHRCLGAHLARAELVVAIEEWHRVIPHYGVPEDTRLMERGGQLTLRRLPLRWDSGA